MSNINQVQNVRIIKLNALNSDVVPVNRRWLIRHLFWHDRSHSFSRTFSLDHRGSYRLEPHEGRRIVGYVSEAVALSLLAPTSLQVKAPIPPRRLA